MISFGSRAKEFNAPYIFNDILVSRPNLSKSAEFRLGLMALASSAGYSTVRCWVAFPLGMMIDALGMRVPSLGRANRVLRDGSCSDSEVDVEEEADEIGDLAPDGMAGLG